MRFSIKHINFFPIEFFPWTVVVRFSVAGTFIPRLLNNISGAKQRAVASGNELASRQQKTIQFLSKHKIIEQEPHQMINKI